MAVGSQLSVPDMRRSSRYPVDLTLTGEHRSRGEVRLHITNISANGFMVEGNPPLERGDRVIVRLPVVGRIEACCMWVSNERAGMQFERIIRPNDFATLIGQLQPNPRLRRPA